MKCSIQYENFSMLSLKTTIDNLHTSVTKKVFIKENDDLIKKYSPSKT